MKTQDQTDTLNGTDPEALDAQTPDQDPSDDGDPDPEALQARIEELSDRLMRALAEVENIRKRAERDRRDAEIYANTKFARDLLAVYDNLGRALEVADDAARAAASGLVEGVELTQRELQSVFARNRITPITPEPGDRFDPNLHQAMFEAPVPNTVRGSIIQVMTTGFAIGDRLLRAAHVGVSSNPATSASVDPVAGHGSDPEQADSNS